MVVVDAGALGEGASGRNAGMIHGGVRRDVAFLERKYGAAGRALHDASVEAYAFVAQDCCHGGAGCDVHAVRLAAPRAPQVADEGAARATRSNAGTRLGEATVMLEEAALESETPCRGFHGGMLTDNGASIHPAGTSPDWRASSLASGAEVHPHTQVTAIEPLGDGSLVHTSRGDISRR